MIKPAAQPTTLQFVAKQDRFAQNVVMLFVWWNLEGITNHFEIVQNCAVNMALYSEQWYDRVYTAP